MDLLEIQVGQHWDRRDLSSFVISNDNSLNILIAQSDNLLLSQNP